MRTLGMDERGICEICGHDHQNWADLCMSRMIASGRQRIIVVDPASGPDCGVELEIEWDEKHETFEARNWTITQPKGKTIHCIPKRFSQEELRCLHQMLEQFLRVKRDRQCDICKCPAGENYYYQNMTCEHLDIYYRVKGMIG